MIATDTIVYKQALSMLYTFYIPPCVCINTLDKYKLHQRVDYHEGINNP